MSISIKRSNTKYTTNKIPKQSIKGLSDKPASPQDRIRISNNQEPEIREPLPFDIGQHTKPYQEKHKNDKKVYISKSEYGQAPKERREIKNDPRIVQIIPVGNNEGVAEVYERRRQLQPVVNSEPIGPKLSEFRKPERIRAVKTNVHPIITAQNVVSQAVLDKRISELQLATNLANEDLFAIVDRSDLTMRSSGTTKAAQISLLASYLSTIISNSAYVAGPIYSTATASKEVLATITKNADDLPIGKILKIIAFGDFAANDDDKKVSIEINDIVLIENTVNVYSNGQAWALEATVMVIDNGIYACCGTGRIGAVQEYTESFELVDGSDTLNIEVKSTSSASLANQVLLEAFHIVVQ